MVTNMENSLHLQYAFVPGEMLDPEIASRRIALMKAAGVKTVWMTLYMYGTWSATKQEILQAKTLLEKEGLEVQVAIVPVGHGTNSLLGDGGDPELPITWQNRVNAQGQRVGLAACVNSPAMIKETREVVDQALELGFTKLFYDDDLRVGPWGPDLQGCFCPRCMQAFYHKYPQYSGMSGVEILENATEGDALWQAWSDVQCDQVLNFLEQTIPEGMTPGIMVMHNGDRRHGVDIARIKQRFPNALFRIGEGHFDDNSYTHPLGKQAISHSIHAHLRELGSAQNAYSESTVYPENALSPENLVDKLRLEIGCGLRNLFLMSGLFFLDDSYWIAIAKALPELQALAQNAPAPADSTPEDAMIWHL